MQISNLTPIKIFIHQHNSNSMHIIIFTMFSIFITIFYQHHTIYLNSIVFHQHFLIKFFNIIHYHDDFGRLPLYPIKISLQAIILAWQLVMMMAIISGQMKAIKILVHSKPYRSAIKAY